MLIWASEAKGRGFDPRQPHQDFPCVISSIGLTAPLVSAWREFACALRDAAQPMRLPAEREGHGHDAGAHHQYPQQQAKAGAVTCHAQRAGQRQGGAGRVAPAAA